MALDIDPEIQRYIDNKLTHQIHTSGRRAFRACRRRWNWTYRDMYAPLTTPEPLEFGVAFHKALETFYQPMTWRSPLEIRRDLALVAFSQECKAQLNNYQKLNPDPDVTVLESYKTRRELGLGMLKYYCDTVSPLYDQNWTPLRVEVSFEVPVINDGKQIWCKCDNCWSNWKKSDEATIKAWNKIFQESGTGTCPVDACVQPFEDNYTVDTNMYRKNHWTGLPVTYGGRLDALFQDVHGRYWVADWKTTTRLLDEDAESSFLQLDDQIVSYLWALEQYGIKCAGFVYVEIKKAFPQPPERLSRLYKGRSFSTNKDFLTTHEMFLNTIKTYDNDAWQMGLYDDHLLRLKSEGPKFTQRHQIHKNPHEIAEAGKVISLEVMDMVSPDLRIYPQPGRFSCNWCLFKQPCLGMNMGEDYQYTLDTMFERRTHHYWEEKVANTD